MEAGGAATRHWRLALPGGAGPWETLPLGTEAKRRSRKFAGFGPGSPHRNRGGGPGVGARMGCAKGVSRPDPGKLPPTGLRWRVDRRTSAVRALDGQVATGCEKAKLWFTEPAKRVRSGARVSQEAPNPAQALRL
jgi:hypothetical protein